MENLHRNGALAAVLSSTVALSVHAQELRPSSAPNNDWQVHRLMRPSHSQRVAEAKGQVFIYDALDIAQVEAALDRHFERIQNMMFTRIHHLPENGAGTVIVEDDGCD